MSARPFVMGSPRSEPERRPGEDQVEVTLTRGFWMAKYETTQGQWQTRRRRVAGPLTVELPAGDDFPVGNVNFAETEDFCRQLTERARRNGELPDDWDFRLPTEAQWEYACRAGTTTATSFGDSLEQHAGEFQRQGLQRRSVGTFTESRRAGRQLSRQSWGLHDMHGNTFEWCRDWYHVRFPGGIDPDLYSARATAQRVRTAHLSRVRRGGCWADDGWPCRSAFRVRFEPERRYDHIGFRVVAVQV